MSQNGLPGGPEKDPKTNPSGGQTLDTCSRKKPLFKTFLSTEREGRGSFAVSIAFRPRLAAGKLLACCWLAAVWPPPGCWLAAVWLLAFCLVRPSTLLYSTILRLYSYPTLLYLHSYAYAYA